MQVPCYQALATTYLGYQTRWLKNFLGEFIVQAAKQLTNKHSRPKSWEGFYTDLLNLTNNSSGRGSFSPLYLCFLDCSPMQIHSYLNNLYHSLSSLRKQPTCFSSQRSLDSCDKKTFDFYSNPLLISLVSVPWISPAGKPTLFCGLPGKSWHCLANLCCNLKGLELDI